MMTEYETEEMNKAMDAWEELKRKRALKALFEKDSISYDITDYNYLLRGFYWIKTLICLLLNRTNGSYLESNTFCILAYDERSYGEGIGWDACWVSTKIFSNWQVCLASDGT